MEEQVQTLQTALHGAELQNQQLRTRVAEMESREGTMMSYMLWMEERLTVLEKRLSGPIMPPKAMSEARMREVIREQVAASMAEFMANMNRGAGGDEAGGAGAGGAGAGGAGAGGAGVGGAGPAAPEITGCTYITFMKCDPQPFKGTEGAVGLCQWFEKLESVFRISDCKERDKVKFATATLQGRALTWWNGRIASMGIDAANGTPWTEVRKWMTEEFCPRSVLQRLEQELYNLKLKGTDIDGYTNRFHELALLCPRMVEPEQVKVEQYIQIGVENSDHPTGFTQVVHILDKPLHPLNPRRNNNLRRLRDRRQRQEVGYYRRVESFEDQDEFGVSEVDPKQKGRDITLLMLIVETLIQIKAAKPNVFTTAATTTTITRPKDKGVVVQEPSEFRVPQEAQPSISKDKGKGIMIELEVPLKRKDQIALDEQIARDIQAKLDAELIEEQKLARKQEEGS
ncbi:reverse transcriptase domain-containing protein [Tanacetum coccineum]